MRGYVVSNKRIVNAIVRTVIILSFILIGYMLTGCENSESAESPASTSEVNNTVDTDVINVSENADKNSANDADKKSETEKKEKDKTVDDKNQNKDDSSKSENVKDQPKQTEKPKTESTTQTQTTKTTQAAHTHTWSKATCTTASSCSCGVTNGGALGHDFGVNNKNCSRCGENNPNYKAAHTHNYNSAVTSQPSCANNGVKKYTCGCGDSYTESIPATGHNWNTRTWTEQIVHPGAEVCKGEYDEGIHCKECYYGYGDGASYQDVIDHIDATGHIGWSNHAIPIMVTEAPWTETVNHSETTCSICGARQ